MKKNTFLAVTYGILPIATVSISLSSFAEEQLETINVEGELSAERQTQSAVEHKTASTLQKELVRDTRDLVRYTTDVGISDNGRFLKGFSIRGVEGNRVGISVDGVNLQIVKKTAYMRAMVISIIHAYLLIQNWFGK